MSSLGESFGIQCLSKFQLEFKGEVNRFWKPIVFSLFYQGSAFIFRGKFLALVLNIPFKTKTNYPRCLLLREEGVSKRGRGLDYKIASPKCEVTTGDCQLLGFWFTLSIAFGPEYGSSPIFEKEAWGMMLLGG